MMSESSPPSADSIVCRVGSVYTPTRLAEDITGHVMTAVCADGDEAALRLLDPACGDGEFLVAALHWFVRRRESQFGRTLSDAERVEIAGGQLFGVDIDAQAVTACRERLSERLGVSADLNDEVLRMLAKNIRCGDALTGRGFDGAGEGHDPAIANHAVPEPLDWAEAFPEIACGGGFDVVVGNPPYVRERDARELFATIAKSPLGTRRQARMDLWYYFLHRGLDLLKPGGTLSFIVNSYWTASTGATRLIERLSNEVTFEQFIDLGNRPVFPGVSGRHHIFRLRKAREDMPCRVVDVSADTRPIEAGLPGPHEDVGNWLHSIEQPELYRGGQIVLSPADARVAAMQSETLLGDCFEVRQGMAENPPRVTQQMEHELQNGARVGEGVFVLSDREVVDLGLSARERALLRPYFAANLISRYGLPARSAQSVLYLTRRTAESLKALPTIAAHLERFRSVLERRRETQRGLNGWWHLHWPREERIFVEPRILAPQMGQCPRFVHTSQPTFVGFATNVILRNETESFDLTVLTGILNSRLAARWFERFAKRRGVRIEISGTLLRQFPLPARDFACEYELAELVNSRQQPEIGIKDGEALEQSIENLVCTLYGLDDDGPLLY